MVHSLKLDLVHLSLSWRAWAQLLDRKRRQGHAGISGVANDSRELMTQDINRTRPNTFVKFIPLNLTIYPVLILDCDRWGHEHKEKRRKETGVLPSLKQCPPK